MGICFLLFVLRHSDSIYVYVGLLVRLHVFEDKEGVNVKLANKYRERRAINNKDGELMHGVKGLMNRRTQNMKQWTLKNGTL